MNKSSFLLGVTLFMTVGFQSCKDDNIPENLSFEQFKYVYLSAAKDGVKNITVLETDTTLLFGGIKYGGTTNFEQSVEAVIEGDLSLVNGYNAANNTTYSPLPANCFSLDKTALNIEHGKSYSNVANLTIKGASLEPEVQYLLPVTVKSITAPAGLPLNEEMKTAWWVITRSELLQDFEKPTWTVEVSSVYPDGPAAGLIDGSSNKFWHSGTSDPQPWAIIDLQKPKRISGILYLGRQYPTIDGYGSSPKHIIFYVSDDKQNWETLVDVPALEMLEGERRSEVQDIPAPVPMRGRYLKILIESNWAGYPWSYIAEIDLY